MPRHPTGLRFLCLSLAAAVLAGCAGAPLPPGSAEFNSSVGQEYTLGPGDRVRISVFGEEELSGEFLVSNRGTVAMPLVGEVKAGGLTLTSFNSTVEERLVATDLFRSPRVSTDVLAYRPFYILGEVTEPGQYPYAVGMTITKAVATAGGFTYRANANVVFVTREGGTREIPLQVTAASWIGPGDTIRVSERNF